MEEFFEGKGNDKAQMVCFFENYVEGVKEFVPADKLLVYNVTEGWEPLCEFLEVDVLQQALPGNVRSNFAINNALGGSDRLSAPQLHKQQGCRSKRKCRYKLSRI